PPAPPPPPAPNDVGTPAPGRRLQVRSSGAHSPAPAASASPEPPEPVAPAGSLIHGGQTNRTQAEVEARAKISWGDEPKSVVMFLLGKGFTYDEASAMVDGMFQERAAEIRRNGFKKIFTGIGLVCVPIVSLVVFLSMGILPLKLFALTVMVGLYGLYMILKGIFMVVAPKSEAGDVAEQ
ncbi:MAG: hypothetical protein AB1705_15335, partial [Verrucomicrobiota bacterium]